MGCLAPCKDCSKREPGCHSRCKDYKEFVDKREAIRAKKLDDSIYLSAKFRRYKKWHK